MNISNSQVNRLRHFVRAGLRSLFRPEPQTAVEWADANYYLPKESAYQEGRWETLPFHRHRWLQVTRHLMPLTIC
ncbi:terminase [Escherichia coli]|nr:terminase [Escherichia coli]EKK1454611.1 terminase [Escherichia coli]